MSEAVARIMAEVEQLTTQEQAELAYQLLRVIGPPGDGASEELDATLARRVAEIRAGTAVGRPADEVFARLRARRP